jgi:hypothetical protein
MDSKDEAEKNVAGSDPKRPRTSRRKVVRIGSLAMLAVAAVVVALVVADDNGSPPPSEATRIVSVDELREAAGSGDNPIYWAGLQDGTKLELSHSEGGRTYVRYLANGAKVGDPGGEFLTVGTYALPNAAAVLRDLGKEPGGILASSPGGGVVYFDRRRPQNVYLAFPGTSIQVEVFDPDPKRALGLVASGLIVPVS